MGDDEGSGGHALILTITWFGLENLLLWSTLLKQYKVGIMLHALVGAVIAGLMITGALMEILNEGIGGSFLHMILGFVLLITMPFILLSGAVCKIQQQFNGIDPKKVYIGNWGHTIMGWVIIGLSKFALYSSRAEEGETSLMVALLIIDIISHVLFLVVKFLVIKKMEGISVDPSLQTQELRLIRSEKDLKIYSQNYFIFADYVYSVDNVLGNHPGGWQIIEGIKGREVDRFIYGMEPLEKYDNVTRISHTAKSMVLAGEPLAKLSIPSPYQGIAELNSCTVK